ncbi:MAG: hypothetical protein U0U67_09250 [Chitinophagales bacterium]
MDESKSKINPTSWLNTVLKNINEILASIIGIVASVGAILTSSRSFEKYEHLFLCSIDILNIIILFFAVFVIKHTIFSETDESYKKNIRFIDKTNTGTDDEILRVNELVGQLVFCVRWFSIILGTFYCLQLIIDLSQFDYLKIKEAISNTSNIYELFEQNNQYSSQSARFLTMEVLTNATNLFSAVFLFIAFQVLFIITIDTDNKSWLLVRKGKAYIPISIAVIITIINIAFVANGIFGTDVKLSTTSTMIRLLGGIYNGVAMLLLFSRFISMEYILKDENKGLQRNFYLYGTIIILPLYVVVQPLYGLINAVDIKISTELFKALVFLVCFWGKLLFLLFVYTGLKRKWIHSYLFKSLLQDPPVPVG